MDKFKDILQKVANKMNEIELLIIIQRSLAILTPVTLVGSVFSLLAGIPVDAYTQFITDTGLVTVFNHAYNATIGNMSLYAVVAVGYQYANTKKQKKNALAIGILALIAFIIASPVENPTAYNGTSGMFGAIVIGVFVGWVFRLLIEKNITIKMPESVPPMVSQAFTAVIPGFAIAFVFMAMNMVIGQTPLVSIQDAIYTILKMPLETLGANFAGEALIFLYGSFLWFFGIHGGMITFPVMMLLFMDKQMANLAAHMAGTPLPYMINGTFIGAEYICLNIAILLVSHRKETREIAKIGFVPALFMINEPEMFGLPIVMNPTLMIPFVLQSFIPMMLTHGLQLVGLLGYGNCANTPWCLPQTVIAFLRWGWKGAMVALVCTAICTLIWIPFIRANDKKLDAQEAAAQQPAAQ